MLEFQSFQEFEGVSQVQVLNMQGRLIRLIDAFGLHIFFSPLAFFYLLQRAVDVLRAPVGGQGVDGCQELVNVLF